MSKFNTTLRAMTLFAALIFAGASAAQSLIAQWKQGLAGARLTAYSGSVISNNSTLTVINLCRNGRYSYYKEGSWSAGSAGNAWNDKITGRWDVRPANGGVMLVYATDRGDQGSFPIYLQNNGRVNIGGAAYAVQQGGAGC